MKLPDDFAAFILTNGRPNSVFTYTTLRRLGYTGRIILLVDHLDKTKDQYLKKYGDEVFVFDKYEAQKITDSGNNFNNLKAIVYARNMCFPIAEQLGIKYFIQLDDDYKTILWRFDSNFNYNNSTPSVTNLDKILSSILKFFISTGIKSISLSQGGDFIGGKDNQNARSITLTRKCMNSWFCSTDKPIKFVGNLNEDASAYINHGSRGDIFFTLNQVSIGQTITQAGAGGMTDAYLESGTYIKSFYSVMLNPSSVKVKMLTTKNKRLHHLVSWRNTVPKILRQTHTHNSTT